MSSDRELMFKQMVAEFPDSPMGHFSLGRLYLDEKRYAESIGCFENAVRLQPDYAAALVALGDAHAGLGAKERAKAAWQQALDTPHGRRDQSLQADLDDRMRALDEF